MTSPAQVRAGSGTALGQSSHVYDPTPGTSWLRVLLDGQVIPASQVGPVTIRHGRADPDSPADAGTCQLLLHADAVPLPSIGAQLLVELSPVALTALGLTGQAARDAATRFYGDVTDAALLEATGDPRTDAYLSLVAVGPAARLGRVTIGDTPWPAERDGDRAARILSLASSSTGAAVRTVDPGTVTVLARDVDRQPPTDLLNDLAVSSRAYLHLSRDGSLSWHDAGHRRAESPAATLTAGQVTADTGWQLSTAGVVNDVTIAYGTTTGPDGQNTTQPTERVVDTTSVARYGRLGARLTTELAGAADARLLAEQLVGRRSIPAWTIGNLTVDLRRTVPLEVAAALLAAEPGALAVVTGLPEYGPASTVRLYLEGWAETVTARDWRVTYDTVPYDLLAAGPRWADLDPATTWAAFPGEVTWLGTAGYFTEPLELGRWLDQPSTRSWSEVDPDLTWAAA